MENRLYRVGMVIFSMVLFALLAGFFFVNTKVGRSYIVRNNAIRASQQLTAKKAKQNQQADTSFDPTKTHSIGVKQVLQAGNYSAKPIGRMSIPAVNTYNPLFKGFGTQGQNLSYGVCTVLPERALGKDNNYVLAGHYMGGYGPAVLDNIHEAHSGDHIYVTDMEHIYDYRVNKKYLALEPTQVSVEDNTPHTKLITLITCSDFNQAKYGFGKHRTVVQGVYQRTMPATQANLVKYGVSSEIIPTKQKQHYQNHRLSNLTLPQITASFAIIWVLVTAALVIKAWRK